MPEISEIATIQQGLQFRGGVEESPDGAFQVIQIRDFDESGELMPDWPQRLVRVDGRSSINRYLVQEGDVLFLARGLRNFAWVVPEPMPDVVPVGYFFILRPDHSMVHPAYLAWYLNSQPTRNHLRRTAAQGTLMPTISRVLFDRLIVPLPPLPAQKRMATLEALRRKEARLHRRLEELRAVILSAACLRMAKHLTEGS